LSQAEVVRYQIKAIHAEPGAVQRRPDQPSATALTVHSEKQPQPTITTTTWPAPVVVQEEVWLPASLDPRLVMLREPSSERARNYRLLQHRLLASSDPRVIAITSALPGEGKTTCAANLALVLADQPFARVLLIEANVRRPALGEVFGFEPAASFMGRIVRDREAAPPYAVAAIRGSRLHIAALRSDAPRDLRVDRSALGLVVSDLRSFFDYIVIDGASVLESADVDAVGECVDGVVVAARAAKTRRGVLRRAIDQLRPAPVLGVVLLDT
jgi:Mrp family chromosome partitioning ATPase